MPLKFGHLAYRCKDPVKVTSFYTDVLGFKVSDWMGDRFSFLRCGRDHHSVNFARYDEERLHHIAFEVADMAEVQRASDLLARNDIHLVWGPIRHLVGHNIAAYHRNPDDQRVEIFAEMDIMRDEELGYFEPRPWHQDFPQRPKVWPADTLRAYWGFGGRSARSRLSVSGELFKIFMVQKNKSRHASAAARRLIRDQTLRFSANSLPRLAQSRRSRSGPH